MIFTLLLPYIYPLRDSAQICCLLGSPPITDPNISVSPLSWERALSLTKFKVSYLAWFYSYQGRVKRKQLSVTTSHRVWKTLSIKERLRTWHRKHWHKTRLIFTPKSVPRAAGLRNTVACRLWPLGFCIHWPHENNSFIQRQCCCPRHFWHHLWPCWHVGTSSLPTLSPKALSLLNICECFNTN